MIELKHQLNNEKMPDWGIRHLFLGTFNPEGGEKVAYYYGRGKNQFWKLISDIFSAEFHPMNSNFFDLLKKHKIACVDVINSVLATSDRIEKIIGKGYKDSEIINSNVKRTYNTENNINLIAKNRDINVYSTWGQGSQNTEWKNEILKLGKITKLVSPSLAARVPRGSKKYEHMLSNWKQNVIYNFD